MIIDTHCHLNMKEFLDDLDNVIINAQNNNVKYMQTICTKLEEYNQIISICEKYDNIFGSVGLHPLNTKNDNIPSVENITNLTNHHKIASIGETGLDYYYLDQDHQSQRKSFENHILASQITNLPLIIHTRDAENHTAEILESEMKNKKFSAVLHCFTSSYELAKKALDLGLYISISGIVTFKNASYLQDIVKKIPLEMMLVETDSPYLAPVPMRGKRNEPAFTTHVVKFISELKNTNHEEVSRITTENARKLFWKFGI